MSTTQKPPTKGTPRGLTDEEILGTFERLGLTDPEVQRRMIGLSEFDERRQAIYWIGTDSGTSLIKDRASDA